MNSTVLEVVILFLLILANGIFAMSEIALVSARKPRLQQQAEDGSKGAATALALAESPNRFLSTVQIGITLVGIFAGAYGGATLSEDLAVLLAKIPFLAPYASGVAFVLVVLIITYLSLVVGELIPKRIAMNNPEGIAVRMARPMSSLSRLTAPLVSLLSASTDLGIRLLGMQPNKEPPVTEDEIRVLMEQGTQVGIFEEVEQDIIESVFRLSDRRVESIMTPRTEVVWLDLEEPYEKNINLLLVSNHSQFPVGKGSLDNVQGILRARDLVRTLATNGAQADLSALVQPALYIPESMPVFRALEELRKARQNMALVIDEYGGLTGMATLFDILEAIVGDFPGQDDTGGSPVVQREDGSWLIDGLVSIDEVKDILDIDVLPDEDRVGYQTLGGFFMSQVGSIPRVGEQVQASGYRFEVMDMDGRRVDKLLVSPLEPGES